MTIKCMIKKIKDRKKHQTKTNKKTNNTLDAVNQPVKLLPG
jgi:hypothetical protein